jgi:hypothetical protein
LQTYSRGRYQISPQPQQLLPKLLAKTSLTCKTPFRIINIHKSNFSSIINHFADRVSAKEAPTSKTASEMVAEANARVETLDPMVVAEEMRQGALLVDLPEKQEIDDKGRIAGSVHIPRGILEFLADPTSPHHHKALDPTQTGDPILRSR